VKTEIGSDATGLDWMFRYMPGDTSGKESGGISSCALDLVALPAGCQLRKWQPWVRLQLADR
jgi:hypothetical protein